MLLSGLLWRRILVYFVSECQSNTNTDSLTKWCNCLGILVTLTSEYWRTLLRNRGVLCFGMVAYYGAEYPVEF